MASKKFDTQAATSKFFTQGTHETQATQNTQRKQDKPDVYLASDAPRQQGRPRKETPLRGYRYNLTLDADLNQFLHEIAWIKRTSMTQYVNDLIRREKEAYIADCIERGVNPYEGWEKENDT